MLTFLSKVENYLNYLSVKFVSLISEDIRSPEKPGDMILGRNIRMLYLTEKTGDCACGVNDSFNSDIVFTNKAMLIIRAGSRYLQVFQMRPRTG